MPLSWKLQNLFDGYYKSLLQHWLTRAASDLCGLVTFDTAVRGQVYRPNWQSLYPEQRYRLQALLEHNEPVTQLVGAYGGRIVDYGVMSRKVITTAGVTYLASAFAGGSGVSNFKYGGFGTGTGAESTADTALGAEVASTDYSGGVRPTGTPSSSTNVYQLVCTFAPVAGGTIAVTEFGIFSSSTVGSGTLWDRFKFASVSLTAGSDSLQTTTSTTCTAGG